MTTANHWVVGKQIDILFWEHDGSVSLGSARLIQCPEGHSVVLQAHFDSIEGVKQIDAPCPTCDRAWLLRLDGPANGPTV